MVGGGGQPAGGGHYTAGGMPLAFTQEDFLVNKNLFGVERLESGNGNQNRAEC